MKITCATFAEFTYYHGVFISVWTYKTWCMTRQVIKRRVWRVYR